MGKYNSVCQLACLVLLAVTLELGEGFICRDFNCEKDECSEDYTCTFGCVLGVYQDYEGNCTRACPVFQYDEECSSTCDGCKHGMCEQLTGKCENGCKTGYGGDEKCSVKQQTKKLTTPIVDTDSDERHVYIWIASCIISGVIVTVIVIIIYIKLQHRQGRKFYDPQSEQTRYQQAELNEPANDNIMNVEMHEV